MCFPCLPVNAGVPLSTAARFSVQANVVFLHQHRVIVTTVSRMATRFHFYARRAQTVRLNNVMS